ncbi:MAG TPA: TetR/AcrR family transcriptional regulator [Anaerolineales bacterium]|nr:TetR/AcrR family transcriptional regulator [Anaerolineales bacterium]
MPKGIPLTENELTRRRYEISRAAIQLFLQKGFTETSMREIAAAAKTGKSTLYDYFKTKDEVLLSVIEDMILGATSEAQSVIEQPLPAIERLRQVMMKHIEYLAAQKEVYLKLSFEVQRLSYESQQRIQMHRHAYQDLVRKLIDEGIAEGTIRKVDSLVAARTLITALTPAVYTSRPSGTPEHMLNEIFDIILKGIQA